MDSDENKTEYLEIEDNSPHMQQSQEYNHLAIVEVPVVIQVDAIQVFKVESPNKVLHDIRYSSGDTDSNQSVKGNHEMDRPEDVLDNIALEGDLSPRLLKSARKRKKQGNGEQSQPFGVQPKRTKSISHEYEGLNKGY
ncbi:hypothetical protein KY290_017645 [Solanum tuberosum]|nr:hypothetical protein KY290_017645 [Solanum tuberosum]